MRANPQERRKYPRFNLRLSLRLSKAGDKRARVAESFNISAQGIGLLAGEEFPRDAQLDIWVELPDRKEPLHTKGKVVWFKQVDVGQYQGGVELERPDLAALTRILSA